jgi:uncharacterized OsmC-like protein
LRSSAEASEFCYLQEASKGLRIHRVFRCALQQAIRKAYHGESEFLTILGGSPEVFSNTRSARQTVEAGGNYMSVVPAEKYTETEGSKLTGTIPVVFELDGVAIGKRRNEVKVGMIEPERLLTWDIASDEAPLHGGDETASEPLGLFMAGVVTCFMTQLRTFARHCGVKLTGLKTHAKFEWVGERRGQEPYVAFPKNFLLDIEFETEASLDAQRRLIRVAAKSCFAEQVLSIPVRHRLRHGDAWVKCEE